MSQRERILTQAKQQYVELSAQLHVVSYLLEEGELKKEQFNFHFPHITEDYPDILNLPKQIGTARFFEKVLDTQWAALSEDLQPRDQNLLSGNIQLLKNIMNSKGNKPEIPSVDDLAHWADNVSLSTPDLYVLLMAAGQSEQTLFFGAAKHPKLERRNREFLAECMTERMRPVGIREAIQLGTALIADKFKKRRRK